MIRYDQSGRAVWRYDCVFRPERAFWPWWFLRTPRIGAIAAGVDPTDGRGYIVVGTGSSALNSLDADDGALIGDCISTYGLPDRLATHAMPGTGELRFFAAHSALTAIGGVMSRPVTLGDELTSYQADGEGAARPGAWDMCGIPGFHIGPHECGQADRLTLVRTGTHNHLAVHDLATSKWLWGASLGGCPIAVVVSPPTAASAATIYTLESHGWLAAFDAAGGALCSRFLAPGMLGLALTAAGEVVAWSRNSLMLVRTDGAGGLDLGGEPLGWIRTSDSEGILVAEDGGVSLKGVSDG